MDFKISMGIYALNKDVLNFIPNNQSFGFDSLNLHSINLQVHEFNERAKKCYEKVGFKEVGKYRDFLYLEGVYHNSIIMDILKEDYLKIVSNDPNWPRITSSENQT